jgi:DNA-binding protein YbaB
MASFADIRNSFKLQQQAKQIRKELKNIHVEAEAQGVKVIVSAEMEVVEVIIDPTVTLDRVPALLKDAMNRAIKKAQLISSERMQGMMDQMGIKGA